MTVFFLLSFCFFHAQCLTKLLARPCRHCVVASTSWNTNSAFNLITLKLLYPWPHSVKNSHIKLLHLTESPFSIVVFVMVLNCCLKYITLYSTVQFANFILNLRRWPRQVFWKYPNCQVTFKQRTPTSKKVKIVLRFHLSFISKCKDERMLNDSAFD